MPGDIKATREPCSSVQSLSGSGVSWSFARHIGCALPTGLSACSDSGKISFTTRRKPSSNRVLSQQASARMQPPRLTYWRQRPSHFEGQLGGLVAIQEDDERLRELSE